MIDVVFCSQGPAGLYAAYAKAVDLPLEVIEVGKSVLEEVAANVAAADVDGTSVRSLGGGTAPPVSLSMHGVEVEGYGAFTDAVFYPLHDRGVCAVVGDNKDDRCADSNGAGKTTLVMAPMWALTGTSDLRVEGGAGKALTKTDVVNDFSKSARVKLEGTADGVPFWVERRVSRSKLLSLRYGVGDEERTMADSRLTQAAMERDLGASVAARIAFHGQHTVGTFLYSYFRMGYWTDRLTSCFVCRATPGCQRRHPESRAGRARRRGHVGGGQGVEQEAGERGEETRGGARSGCVGSVRLRQKNRIPALTRAECGE